MGLGFLHRILGLSYAIGTLRRSLGQAETVARAPGEEIYLLEEGELLGSG